MSQSQMTSEAEDEDTDTLVGEKPPLPGHKDHNLTDRRCLLVIILACFLQGVIAHYASVFGDVRKFSRGLDWKGRLCGVDNTTDGHLLFHCLDGRGAINLHGPVCVSECPKSGNTTTSCYDDELQDVVERPNYDTRPVLNYCMPRDRRGLVSLLRAQWFPGNVSHGDEWRHIRARLETTVISIKRAWMPLVISANVAIVAGYLFLLALEKTALQLVYGVEFGLVTGSFAVSAWFFFMAKHGGSDGVDGSGDWYWDMVVGCTSAIGGSIAFAIAMWINQTLPTAIGCIEATCECMFQEHTLLLEPFVSLCSKIVVVVYYAWAFLNLLTCGTIHLPEDPLLDGFHRTMVYTWYQQVFLVFSFCFFIWFLEFCHSVAQYALIWTTQMWYFTPYVMDDNGENLKLDRKHCAVFRAYWNALVYHAGTLGLGALLASFCRVPRILIGPLAKASLSRTNPCTNLLGEVCTCCISLYWRFLCFVTKDAYMDVAITSADYWAATARANDILANEVPALAVLNGAQIAFQLCLLGTTSYVGFLSTFMITRYMPPFNDDASQHYVEDPKIVSMFGSVCCSLVGFSFMLVFDTVGDTIMYCFATEQRRHSDLRHEIYGKEHKERSYWGWLTGYRDYEEEEEKHVCYAPPRLREMISRVPETGS